MHIVDFGYYWEQAKQVITAMLVIWALWIIGRSLARLPKIIEALKQFNDLRKPIWDLRTSVETLLNMDIRTQLDDLKASVEAAQQKLNEIQRQATDEGVEDLPIAALPLPLPTTSNDQDRWEQIRTIWANGRDRLEAAVKAIPDGRVRRKYETIARYNYDPIIRQLVADGAISQEAAHASQNMNDNFLALRRRKQPVSEDMLNRFKDWQAEIERQLPSVKESV